MIRATAAKIALFVFNTSTGAPVTGDAANLTFFINKDFAGASQLGGSPNTDANLTEISAVNAPGWYRADVTASEADAHALLFTGRSNTANASVVGQLVYTTDYQVIADTILDRSIALGIDTASGSPTTQTLRQAIRGILNKWTISGGVLTVYKEDGVTVAYTRTLTGTAGADPITASTPN